MNNELYSTSLIVVRDCYVQRAVKKYSPLLMGYCERLASTYERKQNTLNLM